MYVLIEVVEYNLYTYIYIVLFYHLVCHHEEVMSVVHVDYLLQVCSPKQKPYY